MERIIRWRKTDLCSVQVVGREGLEPSTNGLKGHCSTIELPTRGKWENRKFTVIMQAVFEYEGRFFTIG